MNKLIKHIALLALALPTCVFASQVAVVDSGTYFGHDWLKGHAWVNVNEIVDNLVDDDKNGKVDDIHGWNFTENSPGIFYPEHIASLNPKIFTIFEVLSRIQSGNATEEDKQFWKDNVTSLSQEQKTALLAHLNYYGEFAHSTHCSGIIASQNDKSILMSARIFQDKQVPEYGEKNVIYSVLASNFNKTFVNIADYLNETGMQVTNMSIGTPLPAIVKRFIKNPTPEKIREETFKLFAAFEKTAEPWLKASTNVLHVIAAGNDHNDNDNLPYFPANLDKDNTITVAATNGYKALADFSNYGKTKVQVAAPGVAIVSSVPGPKSNQVLPMSGTSMAAPFVTGVASKIRDLNPELTALQVKEVLMGTVDYKAWLKDKVVTSGIVNPERAYKAATLSKTNELTKAISLARESVADVKEKSSFSPTRVVPTEEMLEWAKQVVF